MERHDQLYEKYEDALFALLMDKVAEEEGARLFEENERLKNDPDAQVPESFDRISRETIRRGFSGQRRRSTTRRFGKVLNKLAIAVLVALLMFGSAYAIFPEVQVRTLNLLIEGSKVASRLSVVDDEEDSGSAFSTADTLMGYKLPMLSDNYFVTDFMEDRHGGWVEMGHASGAMIRVEINESGTAYLDSEDTEESEDILINGFSGTIVEKNGMINISWNDTENGNLIMFVCVNIDRPRAIAYANEIIYNGD